MSLKNKTRAGVRPPDRASIFSIIDVCETSGPIEINFYLKHHLGYGKAALTLMQNRTRTQFSMAADSSHRVIMGKTVYASFLGCFNPKLFILAGKEDVHNILND